VHSVTHPPSLSTALKPPGLVIRVWGSSPDQLTPPDLMVEVDVFLPSLVYVGKEVRSSYD
jgi:hypothetical protein